MNSVELVRTRIAVLVALALLSSGCELVGGIFKAGMTVGVIGVVIVVAIVFFVISRLRA